MENGTLYAFEVGSLVEIFSVIVAFFKELFVKLFYYSQKDLLLGLVKKLTLLVSHPCRVKDVIPMLYNCTFVKYDKIIRFSRLEKKDIIAKREYLYKLHIKQVNHFLELSYIFIHDYFLAMNINKYLDRLSVKPSL